MTFSDALPIQFWDVDDDTYNESSDVCGIDHFCYCQEIEETDTLLFQFQDSSGYDFYLAAVTENGEISETPNQFSESGNTFSLSRTPTALSMSYGKYNFYILRSPLTVYSVLAPSAWTNGGVAFDSKTATEFIETGLNSSPRAWQACVVPTGHRLTISYTVTITGSFSGSVQVLFFLTNTAGGGTVVTYVPSEISFQYLFTTAGVYNITAVMEVTSVDGNFLSVALSGIGLVGTPNVTITVTPGALLALGNIEMKSDCVKIYDEDSEEENQTNCTKLITYSNDSNAFGIDYESGSPSAEFSIRLPLRFFHESFPQEEENHALSSDEWITLWSRLEHKKLLEVGFIPYFMHKKLQLILMHDNIQIDGEYWVRRDPYQIEEGRMRYPLKKATVQLTDKTTIERNLI